MKLLRLKASQFRNFQSLTLEPIAHFNMLYGSNGSGKTSVLEMIYFLGLGRSFRTNQAARAIQYEMDSFSLFGTIENEHGISLAAGIEKTNQGKTRIKVGGEAVSSLSEMAKLMPLQVINPDSYFLLSSGPKERREYMDWGVFHVEHSFFPVWQRMQRALKQRNACLQQGVPRSQVSAWDNEFVPNAEALDSLRNDYVNRLTPVVVELLAQLFDLQGLTIDYYRGWSQEQKLQDVLDNNFQRDMIIKYTQYGPQRADLLLRINQMPVHDILSRGEQKLLVFALKLAQGVLLQQVTAKQCIYLLDDVAAELDHERRRRVIDVLAQIQAQTFLTAVEKDALENLNQFAPTKMFHVEHGTIRSD